MMHSFISHHLKMGVYKTNLSPPYFIEVPATSQESESCICVLGVAILPDVTIFQLDFETVRVVRYFFCYRFNVYNLSFISKPL